MKPPILTSRLIAQQGGSRWQKGGRDRVYFNDLGSRMGIRTTRYKTGNISTAELKGETISNYKAGRLLQRAGESKVYFDRTTRKMNIQGPSYMDREGHQVAQALKVVSKRIARSARQPVKRARKRRQ